jgi:hypothetical protein
VLGEKVAERQKHVAILGQAIDDFLVFCTVSVREDTERDECILLGRGHPGLLRALGFCVQAH